MKITSIIILLCITFVTAKATGATGGAPQQTKTTEERVTQLEAELLALSKENNLLTDTLKNNWNAFKTTCGAVLTSKCADIAKESENFVAMAEKEKEHHREEHGEQEQEHGEHERKLRGGRHHDDDDEKHDRHHGGKHHGKRKGHGGKHGPELPVAKSIKCVLKQSFADAKSVPLHCVRSAKRFDMYLKINRPSNVLVMMPPRHHGNVWGLFVPILLLCAILGCCIRCIRRMRRSKCPVHQDQPVQQAQIVLGQPVVLTSATETSKM